MPNTVLVVKNLGLHRLWDWGGGITNVVLIKDNSDHVTPNGILLYP